LGTGTQELTLTDGTKRREKKGKKKRKVRSYIAPQLVWPASELGKRGKNWGSNSDKVLRRSGRKKKKKVKKIA